MFYKIEGIILGIAVFYLMCTAISTASNPLTTSGKPERRLKEANALCAPRENCTSASNDNSKKSQITPAYVRCMATEVGVWTDSAGYDPKQVAKFFIKHHQPNEVMVVVNYCNKEKKQTNLDSWAYEAYRCATVGEMGTWLKEYMKNVKSCLTRKI